MDRKALGVRGEDLAVQHLTANGYKILERNYRLSHQEIDIIAREGGAVVFVEVKTFRSTQYGGPKEAVGNRKQGRIIRVALSYLARHGMSNVDCRFDVVAIEVSGVGKVKNIELIKDAFRPEGIVF
jgi:putative endonuclease